MVRRTIIQTSISALSNARATQLKNQAFSYRGRAAKRTFRPWKSTTLATYSGAFLFIITIVAVGYEPPKAGLTDNAANAIVVPSPGPTEEGSSPSVDKLIATRVAAGIAERAQLPIARNVANLSTSLSIESELAQESTNVISKPQIIQMTAGSREIRSYTTVAGDTVDKLATQFGISTNTIKWSNNLTSDLLEPGRTLQILPADGVIYTIKEGDTITSVAEKYGANETQVRLFNDLDDAQGFAVGRKLVLLNGTLPETERPGYVAPVQRPVSGLNYNSYSGGFGSGNYLAMTAGNKYAYGNCTWYAYERRVQLGLPVGSFWGNANTWASYAAAAGLPVSGTPTPGAIMQNGGGYGHVSIVESVNPGVSITISEMNGYRFGGGFNRIGRGEVSWAEATSGMYRYIH